MTLHRSIRRFGVVSLLLLAGCLYKFSGGGFPSHIRTVAVLPFENQTAAAEVTRELSDALRKAMQSRLGLRDASEARANAVVRGTITKYEPDVPVAFSSDPNQATSARRRLQISVDVKSSIRRTEKRCGSAKDSPPKANMRSAMSPTAVGRRSSES